MKKIIRRTYPSQQSFTEVQQLEEPKNKKKRRRVAKIVGSVIGSVGGAAALGAGVYYGDKALKRRKMTKEYISNANKRNQEGSKYSPKWDRPLDKRDFK